MTDANHEALLRRLVAALSPVAGVEARSRSAARAPFSFR
jgi:hypothetical protein